MDLNLALTIGGIALTILTFYVGYRRTIGAQAERARSVNDAIATLLARHFSLSDQVISLDEVTAFRQGKAIGAGVRSSSVLRLNDFRQLTMSKIFENDYLSDTQKRVALDRAKDTFDAPSAQKPSKQTSSIAAKNRRSASEASAILGVISASVAIVPALIATIVSTSAAGAIHLYSKDLAIPAALATITAILLVLFTELQRRFSRLSSETDADEGAELSLAEALKWRLYEQGTLEPSASAADYLFTTTSGRRINISIQANKNWRRGKNVLAAIPALQATHKESKVDITALIVSQEAFLSAERPKLPSDFEFHTPDSLRAKAISLNNAR